MYAMVLNVGFTLGWALIAHFYPTLWLFASCIFFPALFIAAGKRFSYAPLKYWQVAPCCFLLILISDLLYRRYGGGNCDQVGSFLVGMSFVVTLSFSAFSLVSVAIDTYLPVWANTISGIGKVKVVGSVFAALLLTIACAIVIEPELNLWWRQWLGIADSA